jgi:hypothetical protein
MHLPPMTPEQWAALAERDRRDAWESEVLAPYEADPAGKTARERLTAFIKWKNDTAAELSKLGEQRAKLLTVADAPAEFTAKRTGLLKVLAGKLLGGNEPDGYDLLELRTINTESGDAKARAAIARLALAELDQKIEAKTLQVERLKDREGGFAEAALLEYATETLGDRYRKAIAEIRSVAQQLDGARQAANCAEFKFFDLPPLGVLESGEGRISSDRGAQAPWRKWLADQGVDINRRRHVQPSY